MQEIKLRKGVWKYDPNSPLGPPGGFGAVFLGYDNNNQEVAVKKLHISSKTTGHRELVVSEELSGKPFNHIIPFFDSGIDAESGEYYVVMAKAEKSLQDLLNSGGLSEKDAVNILTQIAIGLKEVGDIIHRDLKPGNVLFHDGQWKLADFGIARFVEDSTSLNTLKGFLSPLYAAPEQWRLERATKATDIYAFGCIAFALVTGHPPFPSGDFRERHLHEEPVRPPVSPRLQQLISLCLRKHPNARPSIASILKQLEGIMTSPVSHSGIAEAGAVIAENEAKREAETYREQTEEEARRELAKEGIKSLDFIIDMMFEAIGRDAPVARRVISQGIQGIKLGNGYLQIQIPFPFLSKHAFPNSRKNIICGALISVEQNVRHYQGRSANLWFCEFSPNDFRWMEVSYFSWGGRVKLEVGEAGVNVEPFGITRPSDLIHADYAMSQVLHSVQQAANPVLIDGEYTQDFIGRWLNRLALASKNALQRPTSLPER
jgi:serine/threonine-protein kinase